ncbi:MAG: c-type cytochrome [bacterium]|nr:c-type cytochrome [bacterium]
MNIKPLALVLSSLLARSCAAEGPGTSTLASSKATSVRGAAAVETLRQQAAAIFGALPSQVSNPDNPIHDAKIDLGRKLYYDKRLSKNHDIACNSCHLLDHFGQDGESTSPGHRGQRGGRNSPSVYNAAGHIAQFWDGRAPDVEAQAQGPVLNPIEMAMPSEAAVLSVLKSIPGYVEAFPQAFPEDTPALTYANMARAIGAFERKLMTPGRFDQFVQGESQVLSAAELDGLALFIETGCPTCHMGSTIGGTVYRKLGLVKPYETSDPGRFEVTGKETDRQVFKVPSLRNVAETGPYFHDGSVATLEQAVSIMAEHQLGQTLSAAENASIRSFLTALTGKIAPAYIALPLLPQSGPTTPAPNPN